MSLSSFRLVTLIGYEGTDDDFYSEYKSLCLRYGVIPDEGCTKAQFIQMVMDEKSPLWCTSDQIEKAITELPNVASNKITKRTPLLHSLFDACDVDGDKMLTSVELLRFAKCVGFPGSDEDWEEEYVGLCEDCGASPPAGLNFKGFRAIVDDDQSDYWCNDAQLASMLAAVKWDRKNEEARRAKEELLTDRRKAFKRENATKAVLGTREDKAAARIQAGWRSKLAKERVNALKTGATYDTCGCGRGFADDDYVCRGCGSKRPRKEIIVHCPARPDRKSVV